MSQPDKVDKILESYRKIKSLKEEGGAAGAGGGGAAPAASAGTTTSVTTSNSVKKSSTKDPNKPPYDFTGEWGDSFAGLPPQQPPVDLRKRKCRKLNMFYRDAVKQSRKGAKNGRNTCR